VPAGPLRSHRMQLRAPFTPDPDPPSLTASWANGLHSNGLMGSTLFFPLTVHCHHHYHHRRVR